MEKTIFTVSYPGDFPNENFSTKASARRYLIAEAKAYKDFLSFLRKARGLETIRCSYGGSVSGEFLADSFLRLLEALDDPKSFHNLQALYSGNLVALPPSSQSLEGRLILGLMNNQRRRAAVDVYLWFTNLRDVINVRGDHQIAPYVENGQKLVTSAIACEALPFRAETSQRLAGAMRRTENQSKTLQEEVQAAQQINHDHENALTEYREQLDTRSKRIEQIFVKRERRRQSQHKASIELFRGTILGQDDEARKANKLSLLKSKQQRERQEEEFRKLQDRFYSHMKLRAPVKLWEGRVEEHRSNARTALTTFCVIGFLAILAGALVPWFLGDYIAASFVTEVCQGEGSDSCTREFSAKGPLTIAGLLLVMSLTLWVIRLQYRVYLSERHLSLDAHEKRAFTETYLAMKEGRDVGANNEAIVLAALFRPTQDGIIRDDDSTLDLSAAALLAKQLSRSA